MSNPLHCVLITCTIVQSSNGTIAAVPHTVRRYANRTWYELTFTGAGTRKAQQRDRLY